jgi:hypothetical protein
MRTSPYQYRKQFFEVLQMLWILVAIFFVLWILGLASVYASIALTWVFFALFIIFLVWQFIAGRRHGPSVERKV